ncbi:MAG TPA: DUF1428 domain-containing protein [Pyrinomonadaceae bacterium]|nr:DUF1428 domain-containing protein [Pyrinomonadaceae bacterium]
MRYVDAFILPVPKENLQAYRAIAKKAGKIWREHGALQYIEAVGDDLDVKMGVSFNQKVKPKPGEVIVISYILYKSRADRDRVNAKVMSDPRMNKLIGKGPMPFDLKRMVFGGFKTIVDE